MTDGDSAEEVRHEIKNILTALKSGCYLIERSVRDGQTERVSEFVVDMRAEIERGFEAAERIRMR